MAKKKTEEKKTEKLYADTSVDEKDIEVLGLKPVGSSTDVFLDEMGRIFTLEFNQYTGLKDLRLHLKPVRN